MKNYTILKCYVRDRVSYDGSNKASLYKQIIYYLHVSAKISFFLLLNFKVQVYISEDHTQCMRNNTKQYNSSMKCNELKNN